MNEDLETMWSEVVVAYFEELFSICLVELMKYHYRGLAFHLQLQDQTASRILSRSANCFTVTLCNGCIIIAVASLASALMHL
jgi:hypothetical protein